jgi:hypothetical protein
VKPVVFLVAFATAHGVGLSVIAAHGVLPVETPGATLWIVCFTLNVAWWLSWDRRARGFSAPYDFDSFVFFAWPIVVPWYLYRTRGARGVLLAVAIGGFYVLPALVAAVVYATKTIAVQP